MNNEPSPEQGMESYKDTIARSIYNELEKLNEEGKAPEKPNMEKIRKALDEYYNMMQKAALIIKENDTQGKAFAIVEKIQKATLQNIKPDSKFLDETDFQVLLELGMSIYERNELESARTLFLYMSSIFPFQVQPHIILTTIEWRTKGAETAVRIYRNLIQGLKNPLLMLYAGDCIAHAGHKEEARKVFAEGLELCDKDAAFGPIKSELERAMRKLYGLK